MVRRQPRPAAAPTIGTMVAWRGRASAVMIALVAGVGACGGGSPPAITAPPAPANVAPWPEIAWAGTFIDRPPQGFSSERMIAVTASDLGFVAVGLAEAVGRERGQAWFAPGGVEWERAGPERVFEGVSLIDVAAGPGGYVAVGTASAEPAQADPSRVVLFRSPNGRRWERVAGAGATPPGIATAIGGGPLGYVAVGFTDPQPGPILLVSDDGLTWRPIDPATGGDIASGIGAPVAVDGGWLEGLGKTRRPITPRPVNRPASSHSRSRSARVADAPVKPAKSSKSQGTMMA